MTRYRNKALRNLLLAGLALIYIGFSCQFPLPGQRLNLRRAEAAHLAEHARIIYTYRTNTPKSRRSREVLVAVTPSAVHLYHHSLQTVERTGDSPTLIALPETVYLSGADSAAYSNLPHLLAVDPPKGAERGELTLWLSPEGDKPPLPYHAEGRVDGEVLLFRLEQQYKTEAEAKLFTALIAANSSPQPAGPWTITFYDGGGAAAGTFSHP